MERNNYIAIFDSGVGGFTTLMDAVNIFPNENFLFFADTANVPYGEKPLERARELTFKAVEHIGEYGTKAVVLACNTATSAAAAQLRQTYSIPILGMEPAIKPALGATRDNTEAKRVLLLSTLLTMRGEKLARLLSNIDTDNRVDCLPLSGLVEFAENMDFSSRQVIDYLKQNIFELELSRYGAIVLGCTHFIWYRKLLQQMLPPHIKLFDGNIGTLENLRAILKEKELLASRKESERKIILHFTDNTNTDRTNLLVKMLGFPAEVV